MYELADVIAIFRISAMQQEQKRRIQAAVVLVLSWAVLLPAQCFAQLPSSDQERYRFFMELMLGENDTVLPIWSQDEPVPFYFVSMYPEGTKLGKGRLQIEKFAELAIDFGRTPCGAALPNFFQKTSSPHEARFHFFVAPSFRTVKGNEVFTNAAEWFVRNGFVSSVELDEKLRLAEENRDIAITIPAVREGEGIKKLITIVVP